MVPLVKFICKISLPPSYGISATTDLTPAGSATSAETNIFSPGAISLGSVYALVITGTASVIVSLRGARALSGDEAILSLGKIATPSDALGLAMTEEEGAPDSSCAVGSLAMMYFPAVEVLT